MNKLITYFKQGKGRGLKAMLIFSVLVGLSLWGIIHAVARTIPENAHLNELIDQLPTLVIKDGTVVEPANINRTYFVNGHPIFYLQTDRDEVSPFSEDGIHLTRKMIALISEHQIQRGSFLSGNMTITSNTIKEIISSAAIWTPIMAAIFYFALLWLFYFLVLGISALLAWIASLIFKFKLSKGSVWRASSFAVIAILTTNLLTNLILGFFERTLRFGLFFQLFLSILLVLLIAFGIREKETTSHTNKGRKN